MVGTPWSNPFFPPQKRRLAVFLRTINSGISTVPLPLFPLGGQRPRWTALTSAPPPNGIPPWACPAGSPRSVGLACPVSLYGARTTPPTRAERGQEAPPCRRRHGAGSGPNHRRSRRCLRRRTTLLAPPTRALFTRPRCPRQLQDWVLPTQAHTPLAITTADDGDNTMSLPDRPQLPHEDVDIASSPAPPRDDQCPDWTDTCDGYSTVSELPCSRPPSPHRPMPRHISTP